ncbi:30S ribosomal protein S2 [Anaerophaga thermohalophila]|jgi:small subunit ribosomal protein S2|uniref:30S ribosomal protein S2 n=1 Tax=Anaerophaga thermohalophila TaxID=177400 RepID=UPI0002D36DB8|nr:30S ribosomal protein S2 [Anaerophaga thermohalophila]
MPRTNFEQLLEAGVHFGHLKRKWNPAMAPYVFMERNGIHIIDLHKTAAKIDEAADALKQIAKSGRKILFVATKKQAKDIIADKVGAINMPYVTERWSGGMLTNFPTVRKAVKKMGSIDKLMGDDAWNRLSKREKLQITRQRAKLEKTLGSIKDLNRLPAAMFVVDVMKEHIAVREAQKLNIPIFAMVDTNSDPNGIDFVIPANDDASNSIELIVDIMTQAIKEGLSERKAEKEKDSQGDKKGGKKAEGRRARARKEDASGDKKSAKKEPVASSSDEKEKTEKTEEKAASEKSAPEKAVEQPEKESGKEE